MELDGGTMRGRATGLDIIRICAALCVFLFHARLLAGMSIGGPAAQHGNLAVPVFFALSGYLVYRPFTRGQVPTTEYLTGRAVRIAPAVAIALVAISVLMPGQVGWLLVVLWSLVVEAMFYAALPLFARATKGHELVGILVPVIPSIVLSHLMGPVDLPRMLPMMPILAPAWWWAFAPGMVLALVERDLLDRLRPRVLAVAGVGTFCLGLALLDQWPTGVPDAFLAGFLVIGVVGIMAAGLTWRPKRGARIAGFVADASYPLYLWHAPVLASVAPVFGVAAVPIGFALAATASALSVALETPIRRDWSRSRARRRQAIPAVAPIGPMSAPLTLQLANDPVAEPST
jgi:peptidoglycan/LPS O-acetylase OafA/YrhL